MQAGVSNESMVDIFLTGAVRSPFLTDEFLRRGDARTSPELRRISRVRCQFVSPGLIPCIMVGQRGIQQNGFVSSFFTYRCVDFVGILQVVDTEALARAQFPGIIAIGDKLYFADGHNHSPEYVVY